MVIALHRFILSSPLKWVDTTVSIKKKTQWACALIVKVIADFVYVPQIENGITTGSSRNRTDIYGGADIIWTRI